MVTAPPSWMPQGRGSRALVPKSAGWSGAGVGSDKRRHASEERAARGARWSEKSGPNRSVLAAMASPVNAVLAGSATVTYTPALRVQVTSEALRTHVLQSLVFHAANEQKDLPAEVK